MPLTAAILEQLPATLTIQQDLTRFVGPQKAPRFYKQLVIMQDCVFLTVMAPETEPLEKASCIRAWCNLEDTKRIMRGKPLPGQLRPFTKPGKAKTKTKSVDASWVDAEPAPSQGPDPAPNSEPKPDTEPPTGQV